MNSEKMINSDKGRNHIAWADYIKSFHTSLQEEMRKSLVTQSNDKRSTTNKSVTPILIDNASLDELAHWQTMMSSNNTSWQSSMKHYATAMHRLATEYWSSQSKCTSAKENKQECPSIKKSPSLFTTTECEKELQQSESEERIDNDKKSDDVSCQINRRCYNDRIELCLWCMEDYFIGKINPALLCNNFANKKHNSCSIQKRELEQSEQMKRESVKSYEKDLTTATAASAPNTIPLFAQLPRIVARQIKPIRQAFFREHHRVASTLEVEQMLSTLLEELLVRKCELKEQQQLANKEVEESKEAPKCAKKKDNCDVKNNWKLSKISQNDCTLTALRYVVECVQCKWSALAHLHFLTEIHFSMREKESQQEQNESNSSFIDHMQNSESIHDLPPLRVLDVGSCYGAFCGKSLSHTLLGSVALEVVAIDLEPIECLELTREEQEQELKEESENEAIITSTEIVSINRSSKRRRAEEQEQELLEITINNSDDKLYEEEQEKISQYDALVHKVWRCDWLSVKFFSERQQQQEIEEEQAKTNLYTTVANGLLRLCCRNANYASHSINKKNNCCKVNRQSVTNNYEVAEIAAASFDVVLFCLLLSFMPTPRLRFRACLHAYLALKWNGLLVIVCTRTQGSRHRQWVQQWVECIEHIGFTRVHQRMHKQLIILSFAKINDSGSNVNHNNYNDLDSTEKREKWIRAQMQSNVADNLRIIADDKLEKDM